MSGSHDGSMCSRCRQAQHLPGSSRSGRRATPRAPGSARRSARSPTTLPEHPDALVRLSRLIGVGTRAGVRRLCLHLPRAPHVSCVSREAHQRAPPFVARRNASEAPRSRAASLGTARRAASIVRSAADLGLELLTFGERQLAGQNLAGVAACHHRAPGSPSIEIRRSPQEPTTRERGSSDSTTRSAKSEFAHARLHRCQRFQRKSFLDAGVRGDAPTRAPAYRRSASGL